MYRQRKRDLNLKPNRQLDKRSSRGMIYENEELRMRTIAICEDVDRGQNDIKKLRKENDHLKREIWGLRDECEKLEEILKKVCISANIPEFQLDGSSHKKRDGDEEESEEEEDEDEDDDMSAYGAGGGERLLKIGSGKGRQRRESGTSVTTFESEVGSCMNTMFGDDPGGGAVETEQESGFAVEDPGSVIINPDCLENEDGTEPGPSSHQPNWVHHKALVSQELDCVKEETASMMSTPIQNDYVKSDLESLVLPDPSLIMIPAEVVALDQQDSLSPDGRKTPVIQITPASSPASNENGSQSPTSPSESVPDIHPSENEVHSGGCVTVVPKTFKVTSEILVGEENRKCSDNSAAAFPDTVPKPILKLPSSNECFSQEHFILNGVSELGQRRSCHFPSLPMTAGVAQTLPATVSNIHHRSFGMLVGNGACCCANDDTHLPSGYQSEPSLSHVLFSPTDDLSFQCCRGPLMTPLTVRSAWNTVDKNIVIGFYGVSRAGDTDGHSSEPKVQEIIDELEAQFDPTLQNIQGIRLIPGRIFISLKNASLVQSFLCHFKNDLVLKRKNSLQRIRIHFIEGATQTLVSTLVLSGIPQEVNDLAVITSLNQFGQVMAPLEKRNYKGIDISERIAKMHLVVGEGSIPEAINVNGYTIKVQVEKTQDSMIPPPELHVGFGDNPVTAPKYGFVSTTTTAPATGLVTTAARQVPPALKPHKPVIRSSSSAPRLETPVPGTLTCPLPAVDPKRQSSVCVGNIPPDQHPSQLGINQQKTATATASHQSLQGISSTTVQPPKKPLARLMVSSPGAFSASPPVSPEGQTSGLFKAQAPEPQSGGGPLRAFYRSFDPRRSSGVHSPTSETGHPTLTPSSSYSPRTRRKSSGVFSTRSGKKEPLPWCGCWGLGCGN